MTIHGKKWTSGARGFTLIELLVVMGIFAILLVIALPTLAAFSRRSLANQLPGLASAIRFARQYAITHRQNVWVVFPDNNVTTYTGAEIDMALRSYAVISTNQADGLHYITDWKYLPKGVFFNQDPTFAGGFTVFNSHGGGLQTQFPFPSDGGGLENLSAVLFRPNGRAFYWTGTKWSDFGTTQIPLTEGVSDVSTNAGTGTFTLTGLTNANLRVRNKTGQLDFLGI
jgi:prepilin-type N-terminal cleavage/methylation domain-containing protein